MTMLEITRSKRLRDPPPIVMPDMPEIVRLADQIKANLTLAGGMAASFGQGSSVPMGRTAEAAAVLADVNDLFDKLMEQEGDTWTASGGARGYAQTARLALLYAASEGAEQIEAAHVDRALDLVRESTEAMRETVTNEIEDPIAHRILEGLNEAPTQALTQTDISNIVFNRNVPADKLGAAVRTLERLGLIVRVKVATGGRAKTVLALTARGRRA